MRAARLNMLRTIPGNECNNVTEHAAIIHGDKRRPKITPGSQQKSIPHTTNKKKACATQKTAQWALVSSAYSHVWR